MRILNLLLFVALLSGCSEKGARTRSAAEILAASLDAIAPVAARNDFKNLVSVANCRSPQGAYSTEVHTGTGDYMYFRQEFSYRPEPFEAVIVNKNEGYAPGDSLLALPPDAVGVIRGHAFHTLLLELPDRFHLLDEIDTTTSEGREMFTVRAKDELGKDCVLFFDCKTRHLSRLNMKNPENTEESISIVWSDWKNVQGYILPHKVVIDQSGKIFVFDFTKIEINSPAFRKRELYTP